MRRRRHDDHEEQHENHEAWVIPYADMITLLMGLFLVMWAISTVDLKKFEEVSRSLASGFGASAMPAPGPPGEGAGVLSSFPGLPIGDIVELPSDRVGEAMAALAREEESRAARAAEQTQLDEVERVIAAYAARAGRADDIGFRREWRGLVVTVVTDEVLFETGSATLRTDGREVLDAVAPALRSLDNHVTIEGHTDDRPISTGRFPSNWELSTARATSVLRYLVDAHRIPPERLSASGFAETRPLATNRTTEGRAVNRRVDIVVMSASIGLESSGGDEVGTGGADGHS